MNLDDIQFLRQYFEQRRRSMIDQARRRIPLDHRVIETLLLWMGDFYEYCRQHQGVLPPWPEVDPSRRNQGFISIDPAYDPAAEGVRRHFDVIAHLLLEDIRLGEERPKINPT